MISAICLVLAFIGLVMYALCVNAGHISRIEEQREWEEWIREHKK